MGCFHFLALMNSAAMDIHVQLFVWTHVFIFLGICLGTALLDPMVALCLTLCFFFYNICTILHSCCQCIMVPISLQPCQHFFFVCVFYYSCASGYECHLIAVFTCLFLIANNIEHLFMFLLGICKSLEKCPFKSYACF